MLPVNIRQMAQSVLLANLITVAQINSYAELFCVAPNYLLTG